METDDEMDEASPGEEAVKPRMPPRELISRVLLRKEEWCCDRATD